MPIHHQHEVFLDAHGVAPKLVIFDPRRARASVELAAKVGIDCLFIFTGHLTLIGPEVERLGIGDTITFIEIAGESCSRALFRYARRIFPKATIVSFYGATEVENPPISYPCRPLKDTEPLELHHPRRGYYLELIDPASGALIPIAAGAEGEIVITADTVSDQPQISPLVRYRTGDMARVIDDRCPEHGTWSFTMPGRVEMDFIKVPGGILRAEEVERVLGELAPGMSDFFELHFSEIESGVTVKTRIILHVESHPDQNLEQLARIIEQRLRVGAAFTYKDGVDRGMYLPIECRSYRHTYSGKRKRMIRDPHPTDS